MTASLFLFLSFFSSFLDKRLKERLLIGRNRTKRASPLFQATYNIKTEKQTINSAYLNNSTYLIDST